MKRIILIILCSFFPVFLFSQVDLEAERYLYSGLMAQRYGDYQRATEYYKKAVEIDPHYTDAYYYWGGLLTYMAGIKNDESLYKESFDKFKKASSLDPERAEIYNDWAYSVMELAKMTGMFKTYTPEAEKLLKKSEKLGEQMGAYNLACLYSLIDKKGKAFKWLENMMSGNYKNKMHSVSRRIFEEDKDFDNIRQEPEFRQFLHTYFPEDMPGIFRSL